MKRLKFIVVFFSTLFFLFNCKPKPVEKEGVNSDSIVSEKPQSVTAYKEPSKVFFKASGTEPFWGIELSEDSIQFTGPEKEKNFALAYVKPEKAMDANAVSYQVKTADIALSFTIQRGECSDGMSDNVYNYTVKASLKRGNEKEQLLEGCGNYIIDYRLHDIWALEEIEGRKINAEDFKKGVPNLEIYAEEARFSGFAGCNEMGGKLFSEKNLIQFTDISITELMCENYEIEKVLVKALQSTTRYNLKQNKLYFFNTEGTTAVFRKVD